MKKVTSLPSMEHHFTIHVTGKETQKLFEGNFTFRRLTLGSQMESAKMKCKLSEDLLTLPKDVEIFNEMVSFLKYGLIAFPDWWKECGYGLNLYDVNVVTALYEECDKFETEWQKKISSEKEETNTGV